MAKKIWSRTPNAAGFYVLFEKMKNGVYRVVGNSLTRGGPLYHRIRYGRPGRPRKVRA